MRSRAQHAAVTALNEAVADLKAALSWVKAGEAKDLELALERMRAARWRIRDARHVIKGERQVEFRAPAGGDE